MNHFPVPPTRLPGLGRLLDGPLWREWTAQGKVFPLERFRDAVRYIRLKPTTSCRLVVFRDSPSPAAVGPPAGFLLHLYSDIERAQITRNQSRYVVGAPEQAKAALEAMAAGYGVNEIVVLSICHDAGARLHSYALLAEAFNLAPHAA